MTVIVECFANDLREVPERFLDPAVGFDRGATFPLTVGKWYAVQAIAASRGGFWYYVEDDDGFSWPTWSPSAIFAVVDGSLPSDWELGSHLVHQGTSSAAVKTWLSFPEWARDPWFYERLYDGDQAACEAYARHRSTLP